MNIREEMVKEQGRGYQVKQRKDTVINSLFMPFLNGYVGAIAFIFSLHWIKRGKFITGLVNTSNQM